MERLAVSILKQFPGINREKGDNIFTLIDVGAMGGTEEEWEPIRDDIRVIGFEPDERELRKLANTEHQLYFNTILSSKSEELKFYISRDAGKSSIFKPNIDRLKDFPDVNRFDIVDEVLFEADKVRTLDAVLTANNVHDVDFLKVDTQGNELLILQGSEQILEDSALGLRTEVEFLEIYQGQPLFSDVDSFIRGKGFELIDLRRHFWKRKEHAACRGKGQIIFGDALYFRRIDYFMEMIAKMASPQAISKIAKFMVICAVYGMHDYAICILKEAVKRGPIDENLGDNIKKMIAEEDNKSKRLDFPWSGKLLGLVNRLQKLLSKDDWHWADSDSALGNR